VNALLQVSGNVNYLQSMISTNYSPGPTARNVDILPVLLALPTYAME
jgi:hypothetical protein